jgi:uncharacterized protein (DUF2236 family)
LVDTALQVHELIFGQLSRADRERYWAESRLFAALFGIPGEVLPTSWDGFAAYVAAMRHSPVLTVSCEARALAGRLIGGQGWWPGAPAWYDALTAHLLPERLREGFGLRYGPAERRRAERVIAQARAICPRLPDRLRFVGPYQEARARLAGARPDLRVRLLNRLWIGRSSLEDKRPRRTAEAA